jgi:hypothetical protein
LAFVVPQRFFIAGRQVVVDGDPQQVIIGE